MEHLAETSNAFGRRLVRHLLPMRVELAILAAMSLAVAGCPGLPTSSGPKAALRTKEKGANPMTTNHPESDAQSRPAPGVASEPVLLKDASEAFQQLIGRLEGHGVVGSDAEYCQPPVFLSLHLVQMRAAGWSDVDYETLAAVSGSSALFAYQPDSFLPKYANLRVGMDRRIAEATGFGYEWVGFDGPEDAWQRVRQSVDSGRPVKGSYWEGILFAGYQDAAKAEDRKVFAMADGPDTFAKWWTWREFTEWVELVTKWNHCRLGRHTRKVPPADARAVALRVLRDLAAWSAQPPEACRARFPKAAFGLAGMEAYARDVGDMKTYPTGLKDGAWQACHAINPQWPTRNCTAVYLERLAAAGTLGDPAGEHLRAAAREYRQVYAAWQEFYRLLGHQAPKDAWASPQRRQAGAALAGKSVEHERAALSAVAEALARVAAALGADDVQPAKVGEPALPALKDEG